ncbi:MAG TPA: enolase C-terminal domain-like protein, partial [Verrucomicrobiae bacterium]|nr:enolase C-terminal domain-like protein [Verrucomicrobiae bacterium]
METKIEELRVSTFKIPTDGPESDGTLEWDSTTLVLVQIVAGGIEGLGFTYASQSTAVLIQEKLQAVVLGRDAMDTAGTWASMGCAVRNLGRPGISSMAIAAVDIALWDLKGRLLNQPLAKLLGQVRPGIAAYGSGGFTSYSIPRLQSQLSDWAKMGLRSVKMKIGRDSQNDAARIHGAREAIGPATELFVDANGAYSPKQALKTATEFDTDAVGWFEEPVVSDDLEGLRFVREHVSNATRIAAGEYGYDLVYFRRMLEAGAVDVLQADATRCGGITGFMQVATLCDAFVMPLSAHTAPSIHQHVCCAAPRACNVEYFYDHYRIEHEFFDGAAKPVNGDLIPDLSRPGLG